MPQLTDLHDLHVQIPLPMEAIREFCAKHQVIEFSLFGSVLRDDFRMKDSDVDVMVVFDPEATPSLFTLAGMEIELEQLFGRDVDLLTRRGVEGIENENRRRRILETARVIYAL